MIFVTCQGCERFRVGMHQALNLGQISTNWSRFAGFCGFVALRHKDVHLILSHTHTHACTYVCTWTFTHTHTHTCTSTSIHTFMHAQCAYWHVHMHSHTHAHTCIFTHTHTHTVCIFTHVHAHLHTHTHACSHKHTPSVHIHSHINTCIFMDTHTHTVHIHTHTCTLTHTEHTHPRLVPNVYSFAKWQLTYGSTVVVHRYDIAQYGGWRYDRQRSGGVVITTWLRNILYLIGVTNFKT